MKSETTPQPRRRTIAMIGFVALLGILAAWVVVVPNGPGCCFSQHYVDFVASTRHPRRFRSGFQLPSDSESMKVSLWIVWSHLIWA